MNSNSKCYDEYDPCKKEKGYNEYDSCSRREKEREKEKEKKVFCPTIIKCGAPGSASIPVATIAGTTFTPASLTLNTTGICNPCSKIEVTTNLVAAVAFTGSLSFQVFKQCRNQFTPVPVGPAFTFNLVALLESRTFTFFVCDCDSCDNDCCTYTLVVTVTSPVTVGTLSINNATLGAITTCGQSTCCH